MSNETQPIIVKVKTSYLEEYSELADELHVFAYTITIENHSDVPTRLMSRHWLITDANEDIQEVKGDGVVGEQPLILPGDAYTYSSSARIQTRFGTMEGSYQMETDGGQSFNVPIPLFTLTCPLALH